MKYFIDKIAEYIYEQQLPIKHLTIILPSQRAKKYLQRALFKMYKRPIFSPNILTINRWIQELSTLPIIDKTSLLFKLYEVHLEVDKEEPQTLDDFFKWGQTLLNDFDELDRYLINSDDLFRNLADIKEIENWSFNSEEPLTEGQRRFMRFWDLLKEYYKTLGKRLKKDGECYMGQAYRTISENIDVVFKKDKEVQFIFAGFNALSPAEISIMKQLQKMGRASIFVDGDVYYINNKNHEAGHFIRDLFNDLQVKSLPFIGDFIQQSEKEIQIINCAQSIGQAKVSGTLLLDKIPHNELPETLLLLADEKLIVPVIKNLPKNIEKANITLGLPLKNTALKSWVDLLFTTQEHFQQFNSKLIYHKDFIRFIKHPFIVGLSSGIETNQIAQIEKTILDRNWMFIFPSKLELSERLSKLVSLFFEPWKTNNAVEIIRKINVLNTLIFEGLIEENNAIEKAIIYNFDRSIVKLETVLDTFKELVNTMNLGTFKSLFNQHWINESIAYYGTPLDGLQIMGLLETRLIDFKNLIVVGLNEGSMPPTNPIQTIIPMDLRKYHGMPTPREKQGLFAHHFYRLLHHAEKCWITYSSSQLDNGFSEPSRYILQIELELARKNPKIKFLKSDYTLTGEDGKNKPVSVEKTAAVINRLDEYFARKTSASALKTALRCPLDFYYKYLLRFGEEAKVEEDIEASTFGSFIHETLEALYRPFAKLDKQGNKQLHPKSVTADDLTLMLNKQGELMRELYYNFFDYQPNQNIEGKNYLSLEISQHLVSRFLKKQQTELKENQTHITIEGLELEISKELSLDIGEKKKKINFIGILDRVDSYRGEIRIMDYKSGKCDKNDVTVPAAKKGADESDKLEKLISKLKSSKYTLQLLIYNMLFKEKFGKYPDKVGIISMVNLAESPLYLTNNLTETTEELMDLFTQALTVIISDLYDVKQPFEHDSKSVYCGYCVG